MALQYPRVTGDHATVARLLRRLAHMYAQLQLVPGYTGGSGMAGQGDCQAEGACRRDGRSPLKHSLDRLQYRAGTQRQASAASPAISADASLSAPRMPLPLSGLRTNRIRDTFLGFSLH